MKQPAVYWKLRRQRLDPAGRLWECHKANEKKTEDAQLKMQLDAGIGAAGLVLSTSTDRSNRSRSCAKPKARRTVCLFVAFVCICGKPFPVALHIKIKNEHDYLMTEVATTSFPALEGWISSVTVRLCDSMLLLRISVPECGSGNIII